MKRNMELVIKILRTIQEETNPDNVVPNLVEQGVPNNIIQFHLELMTNAGLIDTLNATSFDGKEFLIKEMTWAGHDFLDKAQSETVVEKAKEIAKSKGIEFSSLPFEVVKDLLVEGAKSILGL